MSIERVGGRIAFVCDGDGGSCGETLQTETANFNDAIQVLRSNEDGWVAVKEDGEWEHLCPECGSGNVSINGIPILADNEEDTDTITRS
jgi:hypothetical protein